MRIITMSNESGLALTKNLLTSVEKVGIPLSQVTLYKLADVEQKDADYGSPEFTNMMVRKVEVILDALETAPEVLWVDSDIVFFANCLGNVRRVDSEICFQQGINAPFCAGFMFIKSTPRTRDFFQYVLKVMKETGLDDEPIINQIYFQFGIRATALPYWHYPVGGSFFRGDEVYSWIKRDAFILHNNYIVGNQRKIDRFKKAGLWNVDETVLSRVETHQWKTAS